MSYDVRAACLVVNSDSDVFCHFVQGPFPLFCCLSHFAEGDFGFNASPAPESQSSTLHRVTVFKFLKDYSVVHVLRSAPAFPNPRVCD